MAHVRLLRGSGLTGRVAGVLLVSVALGGAWRTRPVLRRRGGRGDRGAVLVHWLTLCGLQGGVERHCVARQIGHDPGEHPDSVLFINGPANHLGPDADAMPLAITERYIHKSHASLPEEGGDVVVPEAGARS